MGRPLNKRYFAGADRPTVGCNYHDGSSVVESAIISQRSNTQFRVAGGGAAPITGGSLIFADADPDTIADNGGSWADFTLTFSAGDSVRVASAEDSANDGVYEIAIVTADLITLTDNVVLVANADDTTATLALVAPNGVLARLVDGAPAALGEMQVVVEIDGEADESARIINAHHVKTFEGNTYTWPDTGGAGGSRGDFDEANLQSSDL